MRVENVTAVKLSKNKHISLADDDDSDDNCPTAGEGSKEVARVYFELTPACNNSCPGCLNESFIHDFNNRQLMTEFRRPILRESDWLEIVRQLPTNTKIMLSGGEPTLHPDFLGITKEINAYNHPFVIFSNGRWQNADKLLIHLKTCHNFRTFLISLHGTRPHSHDSFTGVAGSFHETKLRISQAINSGLQVKLSAVITSENYQEIDGFVELASLLKVKSITFNRYLYTPHRLNMQGVNMNPTTDAQLREAVRKIETIRAQSSVNIRYGPTIPQCFEPSSSSGCSAGSSSIVIDPWGNVKPCLHANMICGNIFTESLEVILRGHQLESWRALLDNSCTACSAYSRCGGGCRAMKLAWQQKADPLMRLPILETTNSRTMNTVGQL